MLGANTRCNIMVNGEYVSEIYKWYTENKLIVNRRYQRKLVWTLKEKQQFINTILNNYPVPLFLLVNSKEGESNLGGCQKEICVTKKNADRPEWYNHYVAVSDIPLTLAGKMFGFSIIDVGDYPLWESVFRDSKSLLSGNVFCAGTKLLTNEEGVFKRTSALPMINGSHPVSITAGTLKTGYVTRFKVRTVGSYYSEDTYLEITPKFYFVPKGNKFKTLSDYGATEMEQEAYILARSQFNNTLWISYLCDDHNNERTKEYYYEYHISKLLQFRNIQKYVSENEEKIKNSGAEIIEESEIEGKQR